MPVVNRRNVYVNLRQQGVSCSKIQKVLMLRKTGNHREKGNGDRKKSQQSETGRGLMTPD